jgi:hypothetical protein
MFHNKTNSISIKICNYNFLTITKGFGHYLILQRSSKILETAIIYTIKIKLLDLFNDIQQNYQLDCFHFFIIPVNLINKNIAAYWGKLLQNIPHT